MFDFAVLESHRKNFQLKHEIAPVVPCFRKAFCASLTESGLGSRGPAGLANAFLQGRPGSLVVKAIQGVGDRFDKGGGVCQFFAENFPQTEQLPCVLPSGSGSLA